MQFNGNPIKKESEIAGCQKQITRIEDAHKRIKRYAGKKQV